MVAQSIPSYRMTPDEYLAWENAQHDARHEYVDGVVYLMAGVTDAHNTIALNTTFLLRAHLRGGGDGCRSYAMDVKLRVEATNSYFYPDVFVICDDAVRGEDVKTDATVVVEVLSESTEAYDRGEKFDKYRQLASLREYVLIDSRRRRVDVFAREGDGSWRMTFYRGDDIVRFESLGAEIPVGALYEDVVFPDPNPAEQVANDVRPSEG